ncbi:Tyrosine-protein kinase F09A5.2 in chromosome X [Aphelenchoides avenae]|nr:Tyrosine-protein kinase F09A5.2 in chromosome X [Aphelenchus avenae]
MELYDAYQEVGLPTRWMAPEALRKAEFSSSSDVWSFGVLAYEMFSGGAIPYADVEPGRLLSFLESSGRLDQPGLCPVDVYDLMTDCWKASPDERPKFAQVREVFRMFLDKIGSGYANVM